MNPQPYEARIGHDGKPYVHGPGDGLGYYGGTLWPNLRFPSIEEAKRGAEVANIAYLQGAEAARCKMRAALGLKD